MARHDCMRWPSVSSAFFSFSESPGPQPTGVRDNVPPTFPGCIACERRLVTRYPPLQRQQWPERQGARALLRQRLPGFCRRVAAILVTNCS